MSGRTHSEVTSLFLRWCFARELLKAWRTGRHARRGFDFFVMSMKYAALQAEKNEWMKLGIADEQPPAPQADGSGE